MWGEGGGTGRWGRGAGWYSLAHFEPFTRCNCLKPMVIYLLWKISIIWFLFEENQTREREVIEKITRPFASKCLHERAIANFYIDTIVGKPLLKIGTMLRKAMLIHFIYLVCVPIFASF